MSKKLIGVVAAAIIVVIAGVFMMGGGGPKPEESFEQIKAAALKKDVVDIEKYVNFDALAASVVKSDFLMGAEADNAMLAPMSAGFTVQISKAFRAIAAAGNLREGEVKGAGWADPLGDLQKATGFRSWTFVSAGGAVKKDGDKAVVPVKIQDKAVDAEYTLDVEMTKENDVWRVKGIANLSTVAAQRAQDAKAKLEELNKEITKRIAKEVVISDAKMTYFKDNDDSDFFFGRDKVKLTLTLSNNTEKTTSKIYGFAELYEENSDKPVERYSFDLPYKKVIKPGEKFVLTNKKRLDSDELVNNFGS